MKTRIQLFVLVSVVLAAFDIGAVDTPVEGQKAAQAVQLKEQYTQETDKFRRLQSDLQHLSGRTDVSAEGLQKTAGRLDDQLEALSFEQVGSKARIEALSESIAELTKKAEEQAEHDEAVEELKKVVAARARAYGRIEAVRKAAAVTVDEVERANAELSEAKIRLLDRQRTITAAAGGEALAAWNRELINLAVSAHEHEARGKVLRERLLHIRAALEALPDFQLQEDKMKAARAKLLAAAYKIKADE